MISIDKLLFIYERYIPYPSVLSIELFRAVEIATQQCVVSTVLSCKCIISMSYFIFYESTSFSSYQIIFQVHIN